MTFITRTRIYGSSWLKRREVKHVRGAMIATVKDFRGHRTGWAKLGKVLNCWQISRLRDRNRGSRNQPDGIHGSDRTENSCVVARRAVKVSGKAR
jgi:hypothetical protein